MKSAAEPVGFAVFLGFVMLLTILVQAVMAGNRLAFLRLDLVPIALQVVEECLMCLVAVSAFDVRLLSRFVVRHLYLPSVMSSGTAARRPGYTSGKREAKPANLSHRFHLIRLNKLAFAVSCIARVAVAQGTSLLPDSAAVRAMHGTAGAWSIMGHGSVMLMHDRQWTLHGGRTSGLIDWEMVSASRAAAGGTLRFTAMTSLESLVLPDTGYVQLLQTGETFGSRRIANVQHSHDIIGELSAYYGRRLFGYAALVGEPAIGPVSYRHRPSASEDPFPPLGHHAQDASHTSFGVLTGGLRTSTVQIEASAFNAREPTDDRSSPSFDGARLDSYSTRVTFLPTSRIAVAGWMGYLADHDPLDPGLGMQRFGASMLGEFGPLSTALIWGMNNHHHGSRAHDHELTTPMTHHLASSVLAEAALSVNTQTEVFARAEQVQKTADELGFLGGNLMETFNIRALSIGATREVASAHSLAIGVGGRIAVNLLPQRLDYTYTTRHPAGFAVYLRIVPARGNAAPHHH